jgi:diguanylate cyclase (GGDEF)-like protein
VTDDLRTPSRVLWAIVGLLLVAALGVADSLTGYEYVFALFYLVPISMVTWLSGRWFGVLLSLAAAVTSFVADFETGQMSAPLAVYCWNASMSLGLFLVVALLLSALRRALARETELAHTDALTGAVNTRAFFSVLEVELARAQRSREPFTVAYLDVDDFKSVNDRFGHRTGDRVLRGVVDAMRRQLRKTDVIARLGGDEFAVLLPATGAEAAEVIIPKIQRSLQEDMRAHAWPVTCSVGVLTCVSPPPTVDGLIKAVDELMYSVKKRGKNGARHSVYTG